MRVWCGDGTVREAACSECVAGVVVDLPPGGLTLDEAQARAVGVLARAGMLPPLRPFESANLGTCGEGHIIRPVVIWPPVKTAVIAR